MTPEGPLKFQNMTHLQHFLKSQQTKNPLRKKYSERSLKGSLAVKDCSVSVIPLARQRQIVETPDFSCGPREVSWLGSRAVNLAGIPRGLCFQPEIDVKTPRFFQQQ